MVEVNKEKQANKQTDQSLTSISELDKLDFRAALGVVAVDSRNQVRIVDNASSRGSPTGDRESKGLGFRKSF